MRALLVAAPLVALVLVAAAPRAAESPPDVPIAKSADALPTVAPSHVFSIEAKKFEPLDLARVLATSLTVDPLAFDASVAVMIGHRAVQRERRERERSTRRDSSDHLLTDSLHGQLSAIHTRGGRGFL